MAEITDVKIKDNSEKVEKALDGAIERTLTAIGLAAVGYAVPITRVDTGLARNSITFAIAGKAPDKKSYQSSGTSKRTGKKVEVQSGSYEGTAPDKKNTVFIGSNVSYFQDLEEGKGGKGGDHMLRKAITEHGDQYKKLVEKYLKETDD